MKKKNFLLVIVACALLEATVIKADLLLASVVIASLSFEVGLAFLFSIFAGFLKDSIGIAAFGSNTFLFAIYSVLLVKLAKKISFDNGYLRLALIFIVVLIHNLISGFTLAYSGVNVPAGMFLQIIILKPVYTVLVVWLILWTAKKL